MVTRQGPCQARPRGCARYGLGRWVVDAAARSGGAGARRRRAGRGPRRVTGVGGGSRVPRAGSAAEAVLLHEAPKRAPVLTRGPRRPCHVALALREEGRDVLPLEGGDGRGLRVAEPARRSFQRRTDVAD